MRIGIGYDAHRLAPERELILGGTKIPFDKGLLGHSDADVLTHAVVDALLGAAAMGDIGTMFPDTDEKYKNISSLELLRQVNAALLKEFFSVVNVDATIVAQEPKLRPYIEDMRENLSAALNIPVNRISVKAKTEEGLGFTGSGEGMAAQAVCLLKKF